MIGGDGGEAGAEDGVRPGGEHLQPFYITHYSIKREAELQADRLADPVLLHQLHLVGPLVERVASPIEQFVGEVGDLEEPLAQLALFDRRARAPALAVDHLLVGQHGHVDRIPVDRAFLAVDQARGVEIEEQRLFLAVIIGLAGRQFAAPVEREAEALQLRLHVGDVVSGSTRRDGTPFSIAAFSAGIPNASQPIGCSTS
jgi:hypothetical protein